jgi:LCP family protein required for cell wall assembly
VDLKDEVKDIINSRPTPEEQREYKAQVKAKKKNKHGIPEKRRAFPRKPGYIVALLILAAVTVAFLVVLIIADMLPSDLTVILATGVVVLLMFTCFMFSSRYRWKRITGILLAVILLFVLTSVTGFMSSTYAMLNKISGSTVGATGPAAVSVSVTEEPFNIYITGIDQWASEKGLDLERSDVNMIATVNPVTRKVLLTSIPRDSYVKLHTAQQMDKLTHTGIYGVDETLNTVQDWLGIDLNYYVKMNFTAVSDIINAMGGIRVYSPVAFESSLKGYKYEKGWNNMSGRQALFFARERHAFEGQDSIRVENQQRVVEAVIKKMTSSTTLLTKYGDIMTAAGDNLSTNFSTHDMTELVRMQITDLAEWDIETQKIEGEYGEDYVASLTQSQMFSVYKTDPASVRKCVDGIKAVQNPSVNELEEAAKSTSKSFVINAVKVISEKITAPKGDE